MVLFADAFRAKCWEESCQSSFVVCLSDEIVFQTLPSFSIFFHGPLFMDKSCYLSKTMSIQYDWIKPQFGLSMQWKCQQDLQRILPLMVYQEQWHAPGHPQYVFLFHQCQQPADVEVKVCHQSEPLTEWIFGLIVNHLSFLQVQERQASAYNSIYGSDRHSFQPWKKEWGRSVCLDYFLGSRPRLFLLHFVEVCSSVMCLWGGLSCWRHPKASKSTSVFLLTMSFVAMLCRSCHASGENSLKDWDVFILQTKFLPG